MDWRFSFIPNDVSDLTARQLKNKVNPKVVLAIRVGKGLVGKDLPILVEDMSFSGLMRIKIKLMAQFPHVKTVDLSFLERPVFDYVLKPLGGETLGFDIGNVCVFLCHLTLRSLGYPISFVSKFTPTSAL
jgi:Ca2+-dependent lipid-binding protein